MIRSTPPTTKIRIGRWFTLAAFVLVPLILAEQAARLRPLPVHLLVLLAAGALALVWTRHKFASRLLWAKPPPGWWRGPLLRAGILAPAAGLYALVYEPGAAFALPLERTQLWLMIMLLYPLISVLPQEILFRVCLMGILETTPDGRLRQPWIPILGSALLFGWAHVIYAGYGAMLSTCLAGLALAWNYHRNRHAQGALWPLLLEHALYGQIIFTTGLGHYFYVLRSTI